MDISVSDAKGQLTELVRLAEEGEEVILTRHGKPVARVEAISAPRAKDRRAVMEAVRRQAPPKGLNDVSAARSQDFLYDEDGLPR
ncbi:type II toxin-antitoxin system Phd/YefM family antitoxin [Brevundimonas sp.]|jgi:prevent-host-death family protein|uniref:type II toxin-antitoxin system Phd/YefM family antitoxin n=1 Tax=Brevundimonas sp. TaxID=1871086 RepID=UPI0025C4255C|nr:type II toxin-antitoxin system prevent-host-death family antitoxin [Brevundimonas sp.]